MITLRPYQQQMIDETRAALRSHRSVLLQAPTGAGKTAITVMMMGTAAERGNKAMFLVHQNELLKQTSQALWRQKLEHGMIAAGKRISKLPVQVASIQTLVRRLDQYPQPDLIIIDEAHRASSATYRKILAAYPYAYVVGLTATPARTDGQGLSDIFETMVQGPTVRQLIDAGYLSEYEIIAPKNAIDLSDIKIRGGDFASEQAEAAIDKPTITGDAVATYKKYANGLRCVVMCVSVKHAKHVAESYNAAGIPAESMDGTQSDAQREATLGRVESGETLVVCAVQLLIEGVDLPNLSCVQWLRPTQSLIVYMQGVGRGLRVAPGKERLIVLDQVSNWTRHGLPDDDREWSLEGRKRKSRKKSDDDPEVSAQQCSLCFSIFRRGPTVCPSCGADLPTGGRADIEVVEGELVKLNIENLRREQRKEQGQAKGLRDLVALGMRRGMKNPSAWATNVFCARANRRPTPDDYHRARMILSEISRR